MTTFLIIIASIIGVGFLAYLIVNFVPRKLKPLISILLWAAIAFLVYLIYHSIMDPITFNKEKVQRYSKVIDHLKMIRDAEVAHREVTGKFTADKDALIKFVDTAQFAITEVKNVVVQEQVGALTIDREKRVVDTLGFEPVKNNFRTRNYKEMFKVPGTDQEFELEVGTVEKVQGIKAPVFRARVDKAVVLEGLDKDLIRQEKEALGGINVPGEYIQVGSLDDVKTGGNWPPSYDTKEEREANEDE